jgi:hypothetical protein
MKPFRAPHLVRKVDVDQTTAGLDREWIVTNGLGGYASGNLAGPNTRRFHGWLIAALPAPHGRMMMLNHIEETLRIEDRVYLLTANDLNGTALTDTGSPLRKSFRLENGLPVFTYAADEFVLEKRLCMVHRQNTTYITYRMLKGKRIFVPALTSASMKPQSGDRSMRTIGSALYSTAMNSRWPAISQSSVWHGWETGHRSASRWNNWPNCVTASKRAGDMTGRATCGVLAPSPSF